MTTPLTFNPLIVGSFVLAILLDFLVPLGVAVWLARRYRLRSVVFIYGAVVFFLSQIVIRIPLVQLAQNAFGAQIRSSPAFLWGWFAGLALTAGLFEEVGRWLGYRLFFRREGKTWANALLYGTGHAACEAIILVGLSVVSSLVIYVLLTGGGMRDANLESAFSGLQGWEPALGGLERVFSLAFHVAASVVVLQAFVRHNLGWLGLAIGWHALTDFGALAIPTLLRPEVGGTASLLLTEGWVLLNALLSLVVIWVLRASDGSGGADVQDEPLLSFTPAGAVAVADSPDVVK